MLQNTANIFSALRAARKVALAVSKAQGRVGGFVAFLFSFFFFLYCHFVVLLFVLKCVWFGFGVWGLGRDGRW